MENTTLVSAIIPVYNGERYLAEAIESVLAQTYRPLEVIVINDGSTDGSETVAKRFGPAIRYYAQPNEGLGATRNRGANLAQGHFIAFLDADDLWVADKIERQMDYLAYDPTLDIEFGYIQKFYTPELEAELIKKITYAEEVMQGQSAVTLLLKRASFFRAGLFETGWKVGEFIDWYLKAEEKKLKSVMLPEILTKRRLHDTNMGTRERNHRNDYLRILKASLDRRRATQQNQKGQF
jgi:glycosyltransferase involved in cell wall biosynthesis